MLGQFLTKIFGSQNERVLKKMTPLVDAINQLEAGLKTLDDDALRACTDDLRARLTNGAPLDDLASGSLCAGP